MAPLPRHSSRTRERGASAVAPSVFARQIAVKGHALTPMLYTPDPDSAEGYAVCSCGWESRIVKSCWIDKVFSEHLDAVAFDDEGDHA